MNEELLREKFEAHITVFSRAKNSKGKYINSPIENQWKGFKWGYEMNNNVITKKESENENDIRE